MKKKWNRMTPIWLGWGALFLVIEGFAIATRGTHPGGTLSSLVWRFTEHPLQKAVLLLGWIVLSVHFFVHRNDKG